jgi:hypothetical protein
MYGKLKVGLVNLEKHLRRVFFPLPPQDHLQSRAVKQGMGLKEPVLTAYGKKRFLHPPAMVQTGIA